MHTFWIINEFLFSIALGANTLINIPQIRILYNLKDSKSISLFREVGFLIIGIVCTLHGFYKSDYIYLFGLLANTLVRMVIIAQIVYYRRSQHSI